MARNGQLDRGEEQDNEDAVGYAANQHADHCESNAPSGEKSNRGSHDQASQEHDQPFVLEFAQRASEDATDERARAPARQDQAITARAS